MKPLDLYKPMETRDGREVRVICTDRVGNNPIVALIYRDTDSTLEDDPEEEIKTYLSDGRIPYCEGAHYGSSSVHPDDLINSPPKPVTVERWVNVYKDGASGVYSDERTANLRAFKDRLACVKLTGQYTPE